VHLDGLVGAASRHLAGEPLGHGDEALIDLALVHEPGGFRIQVRAARIRVAISASLNWVA